MIKEGGDSFLPEGLCATLHPRWVGTCIRVRLSLRGQNRHGLGLLSLAGSADVGINRRNTNSMIITVMMMLKWLPRYTRIRELATHSNATFQVSSGLVIRVSLSKDQDGLHGLDIPLPSKYNFYLSD